MNSPADHPTPPSGSPPEDVAVLREKCSTLQARADFLEEENRLLRAILYGKSSEKSKPAGPTPEQPHLAFDEPEAETAPRPESPAKTIEVAGHTRAKPGRKPIPESLPRVDDPIDLPDAEKFAPCGCPLKRIGEEVSERLDIIPAKIQVIRTIRFKYAPDCQCATPAGTPGEVKIAPARAELIPHGIATAGLIAFIITAKYVDGIPLYRQELQLIRLGLDSIGRGTLCNWVLLAAAACRRLMELLLGEVLAGPVVNMDETRVQVLREPGRSNTANSYMWVIRGGHPDRPGVVFRYEPSREGRIPEELLRGYRGFLQTDGYIGYEAVGEREGIRHLGCWAHARRKFVEVVKGTKGAAKGSVAQEVIDLIGNLYAIESAADHQCLSPESRALLRQTEAGPILEDLKRRLDQYAKTTPPRSLLGKAITYTLNQWPRLTVYLENGYLRPDNNWAENAIRPFAIDRKNWLFCGSPRGATGSAALYSLIETAKANNLEPYAYLRCLFKALPTATSDDELRALLPQNIDRKRIETFGTPA
ncbi:MAG: IS66 family transposase [Candidatus Riflebacteria bacterium]|nr:IS66 family transposase [Candidatus Riflebacteria bacterium]